MEDDAATAASIKMMLMKENFMCDTADLGEDGLEVGKLYDHDIILLDLMLPNRVFSRTANEKARPDCRIFRTGTLVDDTGRVNVILWAQSGRG